MLIATALHEAPGAPGLVVIGPADIEETAQCTPCGDGTPDNVDADTARDEFGWVLTEDGDLLCENCATTDRPTGIYDRAYWG